MSGGSRVRRVSSYGCRPHVPQLAKRLAVAACDVINGPDRISSGALTTDPFVGDQYAAREIEGSFRLRIWYPVDPEQVYWNAWLDRSLGSEMSAHISRNDEWKSIFNSGSCF